MTKIEDPKQITAFDCNGGLYRTLADAESHRALMEIKALLPPIPESPMTPAFRWASEQERTLVLEHLVKHPKEVAALFARLAAAVS